MEEERRVQAARGMVVAYWAGVNPDTPAVVSPCGNRTFSELNARSNQLARALRDHGLRAGDGVALMCTNRPEFVETYYATQRAGLRLTTINWHLTADEAAYIVRDCDARALVASAELAGEVVPAVADAPGCSVRLAVGGPLAGFDRFEEFGTDRDGSDLDDPVLGGTMLYTSGTTGRPKGVYRSQPPASLTSQSLGGYQAGRHLHLCTGPLYHAAPVAFSLAAPLAFGVGTVLMERWDAEEALRLIEAHRVTHTHMVPTMFHRLLSLPPEVRDHYDVSSLAYVVHGAAPCPVTVKARLMEWLGPIVWEYYAATEGSGTYVDPATWLAHPGTVGQPIDGQVIVADESGAALPLGETGLVFLKAPNRGRFEYYKDQAKTAETYRADGAYFTLGDVGHLDDEGFLYLTDRSANVIISGGVNVYPAEVDAVLVAHPAVADAATIGVPDPEWGEQVKSVVEVQAGYAAGAELEQELIEWCRSHLAHFKCPRSVDFVVELPRQDNGKIYKRILRERYRQDMGR